ncbi:MAG: VCBS repeat-containing protein [Gammaproteobacteria bacterium]|nr:VCBS repeat-containing protein [Gammaproteobacteria bacterium]
MSALNLRVAAAMVAVAQGGLAQLAYDNHQVDLGEVISQTVVHGRLTGGNVDDLVIFTHDERARRLAVYAYVGGAWSRVHAAEVPSEVIFVDMINLDGRDRLLALRREGLDWIDPESWRLKPWLAAASMHKVAPPDVRELDIAQDLNGDGLDDIALPGFDGYTVWTQRSDGSLTDPVELAAPPTSRTGFRSAAYRAREIYRFDFDGDGNGDVAFWNGDGLNVYLGLADGGFATESVAVRVPVGLTTDDVTMSFGFGDIVDDTRSMLYSVDDFNGDGVADIATSTIEVGGLFDQSTRYDFHFGRRADGATVFDAVPDTHISSAGVQGPLERSDLDGDGRLDFGMLSFKLGIGKIISVLVTGSVSFNMNFYLMGESGYPEQPNVQRRVKLRLDLGSGRVAGNWVSVGDLTGDGVGDLLVQAGATRVDVYPGSGDASLFAKRPIEVAVDLSDQGSVRLADLNGDGRDDMFMTHRLPGSETRRLAVALSRRAAARND